MAYLEKRHLQPNPADIHGPRLFKAIQEDRFEEVQGLLGLHADLIDYHDERGLSPLHIIAGCVKNKKTREYIQICLALAMHKGGVEKVKQILLRRCLLKQNTALHLAVNNNNEEAVIAMLVEAPTELIPELVNAKNHQCATPLHFAIRKDTKIFVITAILLEFGADVKATLEDSKTTPSGLARHYQLVVSPLLLAYGDENKSSIEKNAMLAAYDLSWVDTFKSPFELSQTEIVVPPTLELIDYIPRLFPSAKDTSLEISILKLKQEVLKTRQNLRFKIFELKEQVSILFDISMGVQRTIEVQRASSPPSGPPPAYSSTASPLNFISRGDAQTKFNALKVEIVHLQSGIQVRLLQINHLLPAVSVVMSLKDLMVSRPKVQ